MRFRRLLLVVVTIALVGAACSGDDGDEVSTVDDGQLVMDIQMQGLPAERAEYFARVIRRMTMVDAVLTSAKSLSPERIGAAS